MGLLRNEIRALHVPDCYCDAVRELETRKNGLDVALYRRTTDPEFPSDSRIRQSLRD
jgi:hypothetical protein